MKEYLRITNDGEIDLNAFYLLGASSKRDDSNKIGFFGSGLKYGLAVLLRNKIEVKIFSGVKEVKVTTRKKIFRDSTFHQIYIAGKPTSLTVEMGPDWEPWFAIREIYSNSLDEKGCTLDVVNEEDILPDFDKTSFFIEVTTPIRECLNKWEEYFSAKRKDCVFKNDDIRIFEGGDEYLVYRKGIQCHKSRMKCLFHYDLNNIEINESRTLKHSIDSTWRVCEIVKANAPKGVISAIYDNQGEEVVENVFYWEQGTFNDDWLNVIGGRRLVIREVAGHFQREIAEGNVLILNKSLAIALKKEFKTGISILGQSDNCGEFTEVEMTAKQVQYLEDAKSFLASNGHHISYEVKVVVFNDAAVLGQVHGKTILMSDRVFTLGKKNVCSTLFEEYVHIRYGYNDCSRAMQNYLFNEVITMMEDKSKIYF